MYGVYDMKNNELCVGVFITRKDIAKYFNTSSETIGTYITKRRKRNRRYLIEKIEGKEYYINRCEELEEMVKEDK